MGLGDVRRGVGDVIIFLDVKRKELDGAWEFARLQFLKRIVALL